MIIDIDGNNLESIHNPALREYAGRYVDIYRQYIERIQQSGLEVAPAGEDSQFEKRVAALEDQGAIARNASKSVYTNRISPACLACQKGVDSATFFISLKCHRDCFYCFNPNQEGYEYYRGHTRDTQAELKAAHSSGKRLRHVALTGGEPLLHKEEAVQFFKNAREEFPNVYSRLYTCGDHVERETLQALKLAGMDEIRFSLRLQDVEAGQRHTYEQIALAREYIPTVMVEMPVLPGTLDQMKEVLTRLDALGIFGINLLEFCFPMHNAEVFHQKGYQIKARPFRVLYDYWYGGGLPVAGSEQECLDLLDFAQQAGLTLGVHYCSVENKNTGQVYQQNSDRPLPRTLYFSPSDYFLKTAKVFGADIPVVEAAFKAGYTGYEINDEYNYLEFNVSQIRSLKKLEIEIGLSVNVFETRQGERVTRELKVDLTTPQTFKLSQDI